MNDTNSTVIKPINKEAVHRICSGQVVLNLAVAVKELIENSLDAGATVIDVRLREYGSELIEVTDNGSGVEPSNFQALTLKHHTSKLQDFSDLISVETFGFRGEALSSLCSLSDVTVTTRHQDSDCGTRLVYDHNGIIISSTPVARQVGTTVSLENIFSTLPVRQKEFLRNLKREFGKMTQLLYAYCLVSTGVKISCTNQTKKGGRTTVVSTQGCKTVRENIACVFGTKQLSSLLEIRTIPPTEEALEQLNLKNVDININRLFELEGFISSCAHGLGRATNDRQFYFVNSRPCEPAKVMKAVNEIFHQYNFHQQPFVFLNIKSARDSVDVNVTPDKRQVFLEHEKLLIASIKSSLQHLYENIPSTYTVNNIYSSSKNSNSPNKSDLSQQSQIHQSCPAAMLSQFRHFSAAKRTSTDPLGEKQPKQVKLDSIFTTKEKSVNIIALNSYKKDSIPQFKDTQSFQNSDSESLKESKSVLCILSDEVNSSEHPTFSCVQSENVFSLERNDSLNQSISSREENIESVICRTKDREPVESVQNYDFISQSSDVPESTKVVSESVVSSCDTHSESGISSQSSTISSSVPTVGTATDSDIPDTSTFPYILQSEKSSTINKSSCMEVDESESNVNVRYDIENSIDSENRQSIEVSITMNQLREHVKRMCQDEKENYEKRVRFRAVIDPSKNKQAEQELSREISKDMFFKMEVIGQFNLGFIIARLDSDLFIVDQHATDEKYNFETLQQTTTISSQKLVVPQQLDLTAVNEAVLMDNIDTFKANGFEFQIDENDNLCQ